jgi:short-subunit dehydrogenase
VPTEFADVASRKPQLNVASSTQDLFSVPVQEVVRRALDAVSRDKARVIPGTLMNLAMTIVVFLPMFLKRLILNAQAAREKASSPSPAHPDYEISGMI